MNTTKLLIYDREITGHHKEFIDHIVDFYKEKELKNEIIFLLHPDFEKEYAHLKYAKTRFYYLKEIGEIKNWKSSSVIQKSLHEWNIIKALQKKEAFNEILFMNLAPYQYIIGRKFFSNLELTVSGILFSPLSRFRPEHYSWREKLKIELIKQRKTLQLRWMLRNKKVKNVFILNDDQTVNQLNTKLSAGKIFKYLPDPVYSSSLKEYVDQKINEIEGLEGIDEKAVIYLVFGAIDRRKNIENIIEAFKKLETHDKNMVLLICGESRDVEYGKELLEKINDSLRTSVKNKKMFFLHRYFSEIEMETVFRNASAILIPYIDFFYSSGVLGHAAKHNKPVVASYGGLIAEQVIKYKLGLLVNPTNPDQIADAMFNVLNHESDGLKYLTDNSTSSFVSKIFSNIERQ